MHGIPIVLLVASLTIVLCREIALPGTNGLSTVNDAALLEKALLKKLYPSGVKDVKAEDYHHIAGAYKIYLTSSVKNSKASKDNLTKALTNLGFKNPIVGNEKSKITSSFPLEVRDRYIIYLNNSTLIKTMESFVNDTLLTTTLRLNE